MIRWIVINKKVAIKYTIFLNFSDLIVTKKYYMPTFRNNNIKFKQRNNIYITSYNDSYKRDYGVVENMKTQPY
jgi:hypothetical protein